MKGRKQIFKTFAAILIMLSIVTQSMPMYAGNIGTNFTVIDEELETELPINIENPNFSGGGKNTGTGTNAVVVDPIVDDHNCSIATVIVASTCKTKGSKTTYCKNKNCVKIKEKTVPLPLDSNKHVNTTEKIKYQSCLENGYKEVWCNDCGTLVSKETYYKTDHHMETTYDSTDKCKMLIELKDRDMWIEEFKTANGIIGSRYQIEINLFFDGIYE